jgi:hypothetical protein
VSPIESPVPGVPCHELRKRDQFETNVITYKEIKNLCIENDIEFKNQTYTGFITHLKNKFYDELPGRIKFTKEQRSQFNQQFKYTCNMCKCCTKDVKFEIDHIIPLGGGGTNEKNNLQVSNRSLFLSS